MKSKPLTALRRRIAKPSLSSRVKAVRNHTALTAPSRSFGLELTNHQHMLKHQPHATLTKNTLYSRHTKARQSKKNNDDTLFTLRSGKLLGIPTSPTFREEAIKKSMASLFEDLMATSHQENHYLADISDYLQSLDSLSPLSMAFQNQKEINEGMRVTLVDWIIRIQLKFKLFPETLHRAIYLIDRYTQSEVGIRRKEYQLVGVTCLLIACKYEEIHPPASSHFIDICAKAYTMQDIIHMEGIILQNCAFDLGFTTSFVHLERMMLLFGISENEAEICRFLIDMTLLSTGFYRFSALTIAASTIVFLKVNLLRGSFDFCDMKIDSEMIDSCCLEFSKHLSGLPKPLSLLTLSQKYPAASLPGVLLQLMQ